MTPIEYQQTIERFRSGTLTRQEEYQYQVAGVIAEAKAREANQSLMPSPWQNLQVALHQLSKDLLIALGITVLALHESAPSVAEKIPNG
jgi:hypothetical protein